MTIEQRLEQLEQQNQRIERKNKRLTAALTLIAVAMCAMVTVAATDDKDAEFDKLTVDELIVDELKVERVWAEWIESIAVETQALTTKWHDAEAVMVRGRLEATEVTAGEIDVSNDAGQMVVSLGATDSGDGIVMVSSASDSTGDRRYLRPQSR